ncbi:MAG: NAD(+) synthetase, partial [candidate division WOR-3 bacterium]
TDEGEIGCSYDDMDRVLREIEKGQIEGDVAQKLKSMMEQSDHKRKLPKICYLKK